MYFCSKALQMDLFANVNSAKWISKVNFVIFCHLKKTPEDTQASEV